MPTDPITAAIRRTIAAAEPMWRDTAVDKLTDEIAQAVRDETPQPATTDDAVERAAPPEGPAAGVVRVSVNVAPGVANLLSRLCHESGLTVTDGIREAIIAWRDRNASAGAEVDREALIEFMHSRNKFDYDQCDHGTYTGGVRHGQPYAMCERQGNALADFLAVRGDAATPTEVEVQWGWRLRPTPSVEPRDVLCESEAEAREPVYGKIAVLRREVHRAAGSWQEVAP